MQSGGNLLRTMIFGMLMGCLLLAACGGAAPPTSQPTGDLASTLTAGQAALDDGDLAAAEKHFRAAVALDPQSAQAQLGLGNALVRQNKLAEAAAAYQAALARDPNLSAAQANLGVVYYQQGNLARAVQAYDAALRIKPDDPKTLYLKAVVRIQENNLADAEPLLTQARDLDPTIPEIYYGLGMLYKLKGQKAEAISAFEKFLELGPGQDPAAADNAQRELRELRGQ